MQIKRIGRLALRRWVLMVGVMTGIGFSSILLSSARANSGPVDKLLVANASDGATTVQLFQGPDFFTGEIVTTLGVFSFDPIAGLFFSSQTTLEPDQFTMSSQGATIVGPIELIVSAFDPCSGGFVDKEVTVGDLSWETFGPATPSTFGIHGPEIFLFQRQLSREADATGTISGDIEFDLTNALFATVGEIRSRFE